jgi:hypothetical protein
MKESQTKFSVNQLPGSFWVEKDDEYGIHLANDANRGIAVQVVYFTEVHLKKEDGSIEKMPHKATHCLNQELVPTMVKRPGNTHPELVDGVEFKKHLQHALAKARQFLAKERQSRDLVKGALADHFRPERQK